MIRVVLDASAILAYVRGDVAVGELLLDEEDDAQAAVPEASLLQVARTVEESDLAALELLLDLDPVAGVDVPVEDVLLAGRAAKTVGVDEQIVHALLARRHGDRLYLVTAEGDFVRRAMGGDVDWILDVEKGG